MRDLCFSPTARASRSPAIRWIRAEPLRPGLTASVGFWPYRASQVVMGRVVPTPAGGESPPMSIRTRSGGRLAALPTQWFTTPRAFLLLHHPEQHQRGWVAPQITGPTTLVPQWEHRTRPARKNTGPINNNGDPLRLTHCSGMARSSKANSGNMVASIRKAINDFVLGPPVLISSTLLSLDRQTRRPDV